MEAESVHVDESRWPVVIVRWPHVTTPAHVDAYFEHRARWFAKRQRFALVIDASMSKGLDSDLRRRVADLNRLEVDVARRFLAGEAVVLVNVVQRAVLMALEWLSPPVHPRRIFDSVPAGIAWASEALAPPLQYAGPG